MNIPADLKYAQTHEWARLADDGLVTIGITDHAQEALGDIVFLELPAVGRKVKAGEECAVMWRSCGRASGAGDSARERRACA